MPIYSGVGLVTTLLSPSPPNGVPFWREYLGGLDGDIRIAWLESGEASLLSEIETALIKHFQPSLNQTKVEGESISIKTMVYMPPELREALERMAAKENRSLSNLIVTLLQREQQQKKYAPEESR